MDASFLGQRRGKIYRHRVQTTLSRQHVWVLFGLGLAGVAFVIFLVAAGVFPPRPRLEPDVSRGQITYEAMFHEIGQQYSLDWRILACQAYYESEFDPLAVGLNQDAGLMQIIPATWNEWAPRLGVSDPHDPYSNVLVAAAYLAFLRDYFAALGYEDEQWMLVAYNWGPYNLRQFLENGGQWVNVPEARRRYALNILRAAADAPPGWEMLRHQVVVKTVPAGEAQHANIKEGYIHGE